MLSLDATIIYRIPALLMALTVHEYAHGAMSTHLGDPTPGAQGRLTMNPLAHLDIIGTLVLLLVGFGWAKPVMVDSRYYRHPRHDMMKVALAGPLANLFLCFLALSLDGFFLRYFASRTFYSVHFFLQWLSLYNVWFAFFNLVPLPPLDGFKVLSYFLSPSAQYRYANLVGPYSNLILIVLCFTGIIGIIISLLATLYLRLASEVSYLLLTPFAFFLP